MRSCVNGKVCHGIGVTLPLLFLLMCSARMAAAQGNRRQDASQIVSSPLVRLTKAEARSFKDGFTNLAAQSHATFVVEGEPLNPILSDKEVPEFPSDGEPLDAAVAELASAYDYDVQRSGKTFQLRKRYTDPHDLPCITLDECRLAIQDIKVVTDLFNPHVPYSGKSPSDPLVSDLLQTLTPEQVSLMGEKRLPVNSLTPEQQSLARRTALYIYVQIPVESAVGALSSLQSASQATFCDGARMGTRFFGYTTPPGTSGPLLMSDLLASQHTPGKPVFHHLSSTLPAPPTTAAPPGGRTGLSIPAVVPMGSTLEKVVADLNTRLGGEPTTVEAALKLKPVMVMGGENAEPGAILMALAEIYGLRIVIEDKGKQRLARPLFRVPLDVSGLPEAVRGAFPVPLLRALSDDETAGSPSQRGDAEEKLTQPRALSRKVRQSLPRNENATRADATRAIYDRSLALRNAAMEDLASAVEAQIRAAPDGDVPVSKVSEASRRAFAMVLMGPCMTELQHLTDPRLPYYISDFDQNMLCGGPGVTDDGKPIVSLFFGQPMPDGKIEESVGIMHFVSSK